MSSRKKRRMQRRRKELQIAKEKIKPELTALLASYLAFKGYDESEGPLIKVKFIFGILFYFDNITDEVIAKMRIKVNKVDKITLELKKTDWNL